VSNARGTSFVQVVSLNLVLCTLPALGRPTSSDSTDPLQFHLQLPLHHRSRKFPQSHSLGELHQLLMPGQINASLSFTEMLLVITARKLSSASGVNAWIVLTMTYALPVLSRVPRRSTILSMNSSTLKRPDGYLFIRSLAEGESAPLPRPLVLHRIAGLAPLERFPT